MMMDGKGAAMLVGGLALIGLIIGLLLNWVGIAPWYAPLVGAAVPVAAALAFVVWGVISWMADGSH